MDLDLIGKVNLYRKMYMVYSFWTVKIQRNNITGRYIYCFFGIYMLSGVHYLALMSVRIVCEIATYTIPFLKK